MVVSITHLMHLLLIICENLSGMLPKLIVVVINAKPLILFQLHFIHLSYSLDFLESYLFLAQGTTWLHKQPLLNACGMKVMSYIAR